MSFWSVAAAQYASRPPDIDGNIAHHLLFIQLAARHQVDLLLFPELSLSGYELKNAAQLALTLDDERLDTFTAAAGQHQMSIIVGMPLRDGDTVRIAAVAFLPDGTRLTYAKRQLHGDERLYFQTGHGGPHFGVPSRNVALAVCADIVVEKFAQEAAQCGADLYATGVLIAKQGYEADCAYLQRWSQKYKMAVLMANHAIPTGGYDSAGMSAFWDAEGRQIINGGQGEQLVIARRGAEGWQGETHPVGYR